MDGHVVFDLKSVDRGIMRARFNVRRGINQPGMILDGGSVTNPGEAKLINDPDERRRSATSIADAVLRSRAEAGSAGACGEGAAVVVCPQERAIR